MDISLTGIVLAIIALIGGLALFRGKKSKPPEPVKPEPVKPQPSCEPPVVYGAFVGGCEPYEWGEGVFLDMGHQVHGCDSSGYPEAEYGAHSPSGRPLTYEWHIQREGADKEDPVYDHTGFKVNGSRIAERLVRWYVGGPPPMPVRFNPLGCDPTPPPEPAKPADAFAQLMCIVRDDCGNEVKWQRRVGVLAKACS